MIQLIRSGTIISGSPGDVERLQSQFEKEHWIKFPRLLDRKLLNFIQPIIHQAVFYPTASQGIGAELSMSQNEALSLLYLLTNDPRLFQIVERITDCGRIGCFTGRVYCMRPCPEHYDSWHSDMVQDRILALSINLSREVYSGGVLQIRDRTSQEILSEVVNVGFGDAIVFRLSHALQHRITNVEGKVSKTAFSGWFRSQPDFRSLFKQEAHSVAR